MLILAFGAILGRFIEERRRGAHHYQRADPRIRTEAHPARHSRHRFPGGPADDLQRQLPGADSPGLYALRFGRRAAALPRDSAFGGARDHARLPAAASGAGGHRRHVPRRHERYAALRPAALGSRVIAGRARAGPLLQGHPERAAGGVLPPAGVPGERTARPGREPGDHADSHRPDAGGRRREYGRRAGRPGARGSVSEATRTWR